MCAVTQTVGKNIWLCTDGCCHITPTSGCVQMCAVTQTVGKNMWYCANLWHSQAATLKKHCILFSLFRFSFASSAIFFFFIILVSVWIFSPVSLFSSPNLPLLCFNHGADFLQLSTRVSFVREVSVQIPVRCCRYGNWGFSVFYSVPLVEFEDRISNYILTAFFQFLCNSLFAIFRRFCKHSFLHPNKQECW